MLHHTHLIEWPKSKKQTIPNRGKTWRNKNCFLASKNAKIIDLLQQRRGPRNRGRQAEEKGKEMKKE